MIEVLFGESEAGAMKVAKHKNVRGRAWDGPTVTVVIGEGRTEEDGQYLPGREAAENGRSLSDGNAADDGRGLTGKKAQPRFWRNTETAGTTEWIQGTPDQVICLGFMLDIGDIKEAPDSPYRKDLIFSMLYQEQWEELRNHKDEMQKTGSFYEKELTRLEKFLEAGEDIRLWYSDAPYSRCGLCFVCNWMKNFENRVSVVKLPEYQVKENSVTFHRNWGNAAAEELSGFLKLEKVLSKQERKMYELCWAELVDENAPLRAMINGRLTGVEEDFYDFLIWRRLTRQPVKEARLIGDILGRDPISIGDWWYASRIDAFIAQGKIRVCEDSKSKYARMICRADGIKR
ncbi:MAG: DUF1835 domain-containing protein [Hungatella sp.]|nr:DUF1835 domain-containing protein [Hungatella sp.]